MMNAIQMLSALSLALVACQTSRPAEPAAQERPAEARKPISGKPEAPVEIDAVVGVDAASVSVRFARAATGVEVVANGTQGLSLRGDGVLASARTVAAGEVLTFDVGYTPGAGLLGVRAKGNFNGVERAAVRAFPVGKAGAAQRTRPETTQVGGERVRIVPSR